MRYAIDYEGFIYVDADNIDQATQIGMEILSASHPYDHFGGDWEMKYIGPVPDDEGR